MKHVLLAAAGAALLAYAPAASALDAGADAYRRMNADPTTSYGASGAPTAAMPGGRDGSADDPAVISPNDPTYSYSEPPHRGAPTTIDLNGDDGGRGTSYPAILGHDSGSD